MENIQIEMQDSIYLLGKEIPLYGMSDTHGTEDTPSSELRFKATDICKLLDYKNINTMVKMAEESDRDKWAFPDKSRPQWVLSIKGVHSILKSSTKYYADIALDQFELVFGDELAVAYGMPNTHGLVEEPSQGETQANYYSKENMLDMAKALCILEEVRIKNELIIEMQKEMIDELIEEVAKLKAKAVVVQLDSMDDLEELKISSPFKN